MQSRIAMVRMVGLAFFFFIVGAVATAQDPGSGQPIDGWIVNDWPAAKKEARKTGKPIFVTFRCEA